MDVPAINEGSFLHKSALSCEEVCFGLLELFLRGDLDELVADDDFHDSLAIFKKGIVVLSCFLQGAVVLPDVDVAEILGAVRNHFAMQKKFHEIEAEPEGGSSSFLLRLQPVPVLHMVQWSGGDPRRGKWQALGTLSVRGHFLACFVSNDVF